MDDKILQEKKYEDNIEELQNKVETLLLEKQSILKDSMTHLMSSLNEENSIEFVYNQENNKIQILFDKNIVAEVETGEKYNKFENNNNNDYIENDGIEKTMYIQTDMTNENLSPLKTQTVRVNDPYTSNKSTHFSLNKLFSKSKSSKKSYFHENKENMQIKVNASNQKRNIVPHLSGSKSKLNLDFSKLEFNPGTFNAYNSQIHPFDPFNQNIDHCIKKTNLSGLRYVLSSNNNLNKHKKVLSLDEAMGGDVFEEKEDNLSLTPNANADSYPIGKKLQFLSVAKQNNFNLTSENGFRKNNNKVYDISTFDLNYERNKEIQPIIQETENDVHSERNISFADLVIEKKGMYSFIDNPRLSILNENNETLHYEATLAELR
jgi:hypothetical protein